MRKSLGHEKFQPCARAALGREALLPSTPRTTEQLGTAPGPGMLWAPATLTAPRTQEGRAGKQSEGMEELLCAHFWAHLELAPLVLSCWCSLPAAELSFPRFFYHSKSHGGSLSPDTLPPTVHFLIVSARAGSWSCAADDSPSLLHELRDRKALAVLPWGSACRSQHRKHKSRAPASQPHTLCCQVYGEKHLARHLPHSCSSCSRSQTSCLVFPFLVQPMVTLPWQCQEGQAWLSPVPGPRPATRHGREEGAILGQGPAGELWARHSPAAGSKQSKQGEFSTNLQLSTSQISQLLREFWCI